MYYRRYLYQEENGPDELGERNYVLIIIVVIIRLLSNIFFYLAQIFILKGVKERNFGTIVKMSWISIICVLVSYIVLIITAVLEDETLESVVIRVGGGAIYYTVWFIFVMKFVKNGRLCLQKEIMNEEWIKLLN